MDKKRENLEKPTEDMSEKPVKSKRFHLGKKLKIAIIALIALALIPVSYAGYIYAASPLVIREPLMEHYHFRMQILVNGKPENFGEQKYQTGYANDNCNADLPEQPIHFHDNKDQFVHIHWDGMTGGYVMKYYGWNFVGGMNDALGYVLTDWKNPEKVTIHGKDMLPPIPEGTNFYVYVGDEKGYQEKSFEDWKSKDLEEFFGKESNLPVNEINKQKRQSSMLDVLFPKAYAHEGHQHETSDPESSEERLTRINNLIGNVVIFVQKDKPTDAQIKERFNKLEPLGDSTCGG